MEVPWMFGGVLVLWLVAIAISETTEAVIEWLNYRRYLAYRRERQRWMAEDLNRRK